MTKKSKFIFTKIMDCWLRHNFNLYNDNQLLRDAFCKKFNTELKNTTFRTHLYSIGLKRIELERFPDAAFNFLLNNYQNIGNAEMAALFNKWFPKNKPWTRKHIDRKMVHSGIKRTKQDQLNIKIRKRKAILSKYQNQ